MVGLGNPIARVSSSSVGGSSAAAMCSSTVNARSHNFVIYGHKATLEIGDQGNVLQMIPERAFAEEFEGISETERKELGIEQIKGLQHEDIRVHEKNWFDSIRAYCVD